MRKLLLALLFLTSCAHAQLWNSIITSPRAIDWRNSGPQTLPAGYTQCGSTIAAYTGTAATINTAISGCGPSTFIQLGTGTFTLSTGILNNKNKVILNGNGANLTKINFTSAATSSCNGFSAVVCLFGGDSTFWTPGTGITVTGGLTQGSTSITVSSATGISTSKAIVINGADTGKSGVPCTGTSTDNGNVYNTGDQYNATGPTGASFSGPDSGNGTACRFQSEVHTITNVVGTTITLGEPIEHNTGWNSPQAWTFTPITGSGVTNIGITVASGTSAIYGIGMFNGCNNIITGNSVNSAQVAGIALTDSCHNLVESNYVYSAQSSDNFGIHVTQSSDDIIDNNIVQQNTVGFMCEGSCSGDVIAYNYFTAMCNYLGASQDCASDNVSQAIRFHSNGDDFNLIEGNVGTAIDADGTHGTHLFNTFYRNVLPGWESCGLRAYCGTNVAKDFLTNSILLYALQGRYHNILANLLGTTGYHDTYQYTTGQTNTALYGIGIPVSGSTPPTDSIVSSTLMRWGNYDVVNAATRWVTGEVPSGISVDPNTVPSSICTSSSPATCPASFYLTSKPSWWASTSPFPASGPDVSSGNLGQCSGALNTVGQFNGLLSESNAQCGGHGFTTSAFAGHANSIPAMDCFLNTMNGPLDGTGTVLSFNAASCFVASSPQANTPTFSPVAGTYTTSQSITISTTSAGAIICWNTTGAPSTNGTTGCSSGTLYSGPVTVASNETLFAVAGGTGFTDSTAGSAAYVIAPVVATPTFSPVAGTYVSTQFVVISTITTSSTLCYTTDGTTPTATTPGTCSHGTTYSGAITISSSLTLMAIGTKSGDTNSSVATAAYIITNTPPPAPALNIIVHLSRRDYEDHIPYYLDPVVISLCDPAHTYTHPTLSSISG